MLLENKRAVITGGGSGLGLAIAEAFLREGAKVCILGRRKDKLKEAAHILDKSGENIRYFQADIVKEEEAERAVEFSRVEMGGIDILVNNAGIMRFAPLCDCTPQMLRETFEINTYAPVTMIRLVVPIMRSSGGGSIINMTSLSGIRPVKGSSVYCASKTALIMISQSLALEVAQDNIRINLIAPGLIEDTELGNAMFSPEQVKASYERFKGLHPLGRNGKPEDIAQSALFLASSASSYITGAVIPVDGGRFLTMNG